MSAARCVVLASVLLPLFACSSSDVTAITAAQAIRLANKACYKSWGKMGERNGIAWRVKSDMWHAKITGDHWMVWTGAAQSPALETDVPLQGGQLDSRTCKQRFDD